MKIVFDASADTYALVAYLVAKDELSGLALPLDANLLVRDAAKAARFEAGAGEVFDTFVSQGGRTLRVALVGTGGGTRADMERAGGQLVAKYQRSGVESLAVDMSVGAIATNRDAAAQVLFGAHLRSWSHDQYRTKLPVKSKVTLGEIGVVHAPKGLQAAWSDHAAIAEGVALTRELVTEPANIIYPESFVERCKPLEAMGMEITVLGQDEMEKLGMGALLGVSQGSVRPPRLIAMRWNGTGNPHSKPVVLVGKGVTFDTGGISIKPAAGMEDMKWDMGGAGAVAGTMKALAGRKAKAHVIGICGLVENMPDGNAQRPGDVVTSMSGQTIEVINTDAEGRLVLCDALHWAQEQYDPEYVVDLATLTGAIIISLADQYGGLFSNDDGLAEKLAAAGKTAGDPLWRFPLSKAYDKLIDSPIADIKNVGPRGGGSITAAQFLQRFIKPGVKWAHLDIAGMVWADKPGPVWDKGATGYGVRLLNQWIADNFEG
ncbi:leucyl aminopeptidase [Blastomonas fulva]|uniref:leucyl aminopeptidase n=1 Tax=Blastomonas fulva TaxID=1550728 RepID=UPI0025A357D5|nr:leucyl aminopeptidase [Blastomonas fulva]MDM7965596.1 leucyl aminopeptidase [Blastomonas fulva]